MTDEERERISKERKEAVEKVTVSLLPQLAAIGPLAGFRLIVQWKDGFSADSFVTAEENFRAAMDLAKRNLKNN